MRCGSGRTRRLLTGLPLNALLAVEREAALADADSRVWRAPAGGETLSATPDAGPPAQRRRHTLPVERRPSRATLPEETAIDPLRRRGPGWLLPALLRPAEKRTVDLISDWPWVDQTGLHRLLGVSGPRASQLLASVERFGLAARIPIEGRTRWALTGRGLGLLARRDRTSVGAARKRWSVEPVRPGAPTTWRNVSGTRSRQLLRNIEHTSAVHGFVAALAAQARSLGWEPVQLDPPHRASRFFRHDGALHSVRPDAFGIVRGRGRAQPFFLEWERRAVRPATMAARLAPYLRYFSSGRPVDDHGVQPPRAGGLRRRAQRGPVPARGEAGDGEEQGAAFRSGSPTGRRWMRPGRWDVPGWTPGRWEPDHAFA